MQSKFNDIIVVTFFKLADSPSDWFTTVWTAGPANRVKGHTLHILTGVVQHKGEVLILQSVFIQEGMQKRVYEHSDVAWERKCWGLLWNKNAWKLQWDASWLYTFQAQL